MSEPLFIPLESSKINVPSTKTTGKIETASSLPPYYVPYGILVTESDHHDTGTCTISFIYDSPQEEPLKRREIISGISLFVGAKSSRVMEVQVESTIWQQMKNDEYDYSALIQNMSLAQVKPKKPSLEKTFMATKSIFENYQKDLVSIAC